jgi:hypothetical protein
MAMKDKSIMKLVGKYCFDVLAAFDSPGLITYVCVCVYVCVFIYLSTSFIHLYINIYVIAIDCNDLFSYLLEYLLMYSMSQYWDFV